MKHHLLPPKFGISGRKSYIGKQLFSWLISKICYQYLILFIFLLYQHSSLTLLIALNVNPIIVELYKYAVCEEQLLAVFHSDFRTKNGAHTTLTMIPNSRKQVPCVFLLVLEIIWDWDKKRWPIPLRMS